MLWKGRRQSDNVEDRRCTSAQRVRWFTLGLKTGDLRQGDTFAVDEL